MKKPQKISNDSLNRLFRIHALLQVTQEQLEEMQNNSTFKHDQKQRLNNTFNWINGLVENWTNSSNTNEIQVYNDICQEIRKFISSVNIEFQK